MQGMQVLSLFCGLTNTYLMLQGWTGWEYTFYPVENHLVSEPKLVAFVKVHGLGIRGPSMSSMILKGHNLQTPQNRVAWLYVPCIKKLSMHNEIEKYKIQKSRYCHNASFKCITHA